MGASILSGLIQYVFSLTLCALPATTFPQFDDLTSAAGLLKVETVGPVYMVRGLPPLAS